MDEDPKVKEAEEYNEAGNCAFKDKEYEKIFPPYRKSDIPDHLWLWLSFYQDGHGSRDRLP